MRTGQQCNELFQNVVNLLWEVLEQRRVNGADTYWVFWMVPKDPLNP